MRLDLRGTLLTDEEFRRKYFSILNHITFLNVKYAENILSIPLNLRKLTKLNCSTSSIKLIPSLINLKELVCYDTEISRLPNLPNLEFLNCCRTNIKNVPNFPKLKELDCSDTPIKTIQSKNIEVLYCNNCPNLMQLPILPKLKELVCSDVPIFEKYNIEDEDTYKHFFEIIFKLELVQLRLKKEKKEYLLPELIRKVMEF